MTEQLLYEVHDPAAYLTPDVVADITRGDASPSSGPTACALAGVRGHRAAGDAEGQRVLRTAAGWPKARSPMPGARAEARARLAARRRCASGCARLRAACAST